MIFDRTTVYRTLGDFLAALDAAGQLARIDEPVSTVLEVTELHRRVIERQGPVLRFEQPIKADAQRLPYRW